jgi:hypothetical protein
MNDDDIATALRDSVTGVHMTIPTGHIIDRGRAIRAQRRVPGITAGALVLVAGAGISVTAIHTTGHHQPTVQLAAWTVVKEPDGNVTVTLRDLKDIAGLQRKLRADGVPASVTSRGHQNPSCRPYPASRAVLDKVFRQPQPPAKRHTWSAKSAKSVPINPLNVKVLLIHPSSLPAGTGVQLDFTLGRPHPPLRSRHAIRFVPIFAAGPSLVYASAHCTGS